MKKEKVSERVKSHKSYTTTSGLLVPGASTIAKMSSDNTDILMAWVAKLTKQGINYREYTKEKASIGTLAHYLILQHLKNEKPVLDDYPKDIIDKSENSFLSYLNWEKDKEVKPIWVEKDFTSDVYLFGGCLDFYGTVNGVHTLLDFKTGSSIYDNYFIQLAGYALLLEENANHAASNIILNIPRSEDEGFKTEERKQLDIEKQIFLSLCKVYHLKNQLKFKLKGD